MADNTTPTIVYLDQNKWIELLRQNEGVSSNQETQQVLDIIRVCSEKKLAIFPLSITHIRETATSHNRRNRRTKMFEFMADISKLYALAPQDIINIGEKNYFLQHQIGRSGDVMDEVLGQGVPFVFAGNHWHITADDDETAEFLEDFAEGTEAFERLLEEDVLSEFSKEEEDIEFLEELEEIRQMHEDEFDDNRRRRRFGLARYFRDELLPELWTKLVLSNADHTILDVDLDSYVKGSDDEDNVEKLIRKFPRSYTYVTLTVTRDLQKSRSIKSNDLDDIMALSVAIPYCDIVVTEKFWSHEACAQNLDEIYNTEIISNLTDLYSLLPQS